jgi:cytochrome c
VVTAAGAAAAAQPAVDPATRRLFLQCRSCHSVQSGQPHKVGPNLAGVMGQRAGTRPGYKYSQPLAASGVIWTDAAMDRWLQKPSAVVPGNKMVFSGMAKAEDRKKLIAYMRTQAR